MRPSIALTFLALAAIDSAFSQTPPSFEVASVKPSENLTTGRTGPTRIHGGPGSSDPGLAVFENADLFGLVTMAYGVKRYQLSAPDWVSTTKFNISARVPQGTTTDQYRLMLQSLLAERFKLTVHHEQKEMRIYELVVAKTGLKLKESGPEPVDDTEQGLQPAPPRAGPPPGFRGPFHMSLPKISIAQFAALLSGALDEPIEDKTGLKALYEIEFRAMVGATPVESDQANSPPSILDAVQGLGLRLEPKKSLTDVLVIDHMEKTPTEN
jgi:uncharacterized protein (TIGR03435 family)